MELRPSFRSSFARSLYERMLNDQHLRSLDKSKWYSCDLSSVPESICSSFVQLSTDNETEEFLETSFQKSECLFTQLFHAFARVFLCWFMTRTSANGVLGRGSMFVLSKQQFEILLRDSVNLTSVHTLLDIGAGDGRVTDRVAPFFQNVYVTEVSHVMCKQLSLKGYNVLNVESWWKESEEPTTFDVICCLNVLDRCDKPITMLNQMRNKLTPSTGLIILALVLPVQQFVESSTRKDHKPSEIICLEGSTFVEQVVSLVTNFFPENGFHVIKWSRVPYLCEGDLQQSFYYLDDVIFVLKPIS